MLEAAPALVTIVMGCRDQISNGTAALQSITTALRNGALQSLQGVVLVNFDLNVEDVKDFTIALGGVSCAKRLTCLMFINCGLDAVGARVLAAVLSQGCFPALQKLFLSKNPNLTDVGVVALAEALSKTTQTFLTNLNLSDVGMGDEGIGALASLISQGRMEQLEELSLSSNSAVTKQGIIALAKAVDARGLPKLRALNLDGLVRETDDETVLGITTLVHAIAEGCLPLEEFTFDPAHSDVITSILKAANWNGESSMH
jgi:Ran GTPase-activating protein (RanGAP) involved in mRNA processing and transport